MAFNDTLFQLGMDLTRSSTAQKEDLSFVESVAEPEVRSEFPSYRESVSPAGQHLVIDIYGAKRLDDVTLIEDTLKRCASVAGGNVQHVHVSPLSGNGGVSGVAVLSESHITVQARPSAGYAAFDVFMSGEAKPQRCVELLREAFAASQVAVRSIGRGEAALKIVSRPDAKAPVRLKALKGGKRAKAA